MASYHKTRRILLSDFFLPESKYIELELRLEELQGAHEVGGHALGGAHPLGQVVGPLVFIFCKDFFIISETMFREVSDHSDNFCFCT